MRRVDADELYKLLYGLRAEMTTGAFRTEAAFDERMDAAFPAAPAASAGVDMERVHEAFHGAAFPDDRPYAPYKLDAADRAGIDAAIAEYERQVKEKRYE